MHRPESSPAGTRRPRRHAAARDGAVRASLAVAIIGAAATGTSARAAVPPLPQLPDRQMTSRSGTALGNELLRRNFDASEILRVRELATKTLSGGFDRVLSPRERVAVTPAPALMGAGTPCRTLAITLDPAWPSNYLPSIHIDGPWCLTQTGWSATTLTINGAWPKAPSQVPRPWDNHGLETTRLVVNATNSNGAG